MTLTQPDVPQSRAALCEARPMSSSEEPRPHGVCLCTTRAALPPEAGPQTSVLSLLSHIRSVHTTRASVVSEGVSVGSVDVERWTLCVTRVMLLVAHESGTSPVQSRVGDTVTDIRDSSQQDDSMQVDCLGLCAGLSRRENGAVCSGTKEHVLM